MLTSEQQFYIENKNVGNKELSEDWRSEWGPGRRDITEELQKTFFVREGEKERDGERSAAANTLN